MTARFDDLRPHRRRSFQLDDPTDVLVAHSLDEVPLVLQAAEDAVARSRWVAGFVSYDAAPAFDPALRVWAQSPRGQGHAPLAWFAVYDERRPSSPGLGSYRIGEWIPSVDEIEYRAGIDAIRAHIRVGDTYQVNHTFRLHAEFSGNAEALYADLASSQTCGYGSYLDCGRWAIASASPELFFEWKHDRILSRPMKGTIRRGTTLASDEKQRRTLYGSEKDRAENLMIVDMVRNDLGRIARTGSVRVPDLFTIEKYDTVWQMTSTVAGRPRPDVGLLDVFAALFPCASITGAPKVATMEIISQLETTARGVYCGTVGFGGPSPTGPQWAFNVAIRTVTIDRERGVAEYGTGGGITYDSTAESEYDEALLKTRVLDRRTADLQLIETMLWDPSTGFPHLAEHLSRLSSSAWYFDVPLDPAEVRAALTRATRSAGKPSKVRLLVDRTGWLSVEIASFDPRSDGPLRLAIDSDPVDPDDPFLYHKTTNRSTYERALARHPDADDVILVNVHGNVTETAFGNIAVDLDGRWTTPPVADGLLPGTMRRALIDAGELGERSISVAELRDSPRVARVNAVRGWQDATLVL